MKKFLVLLVALMAVLTLSACQTDSASGTMNWNIGADPLTLDPSLNGASDGGDVINNTFEGLVRERNGEILPGIAESWEVVENGTKVIFHLRESNWSNGDPLTAHDFEYAWKRGMNPETASEYSWIWEYTNVVGAVEAVYEGGSLDDVGVYAEDDLTFVVELLQPTDYFVSLTAFYHFLPVHQASVEANPEGGMWAKDPATAVSNGPFVLTAYTAGEGLTLEKNQEYWNKDIVQIATIEAKFIDDANTAYTAFQAGEFDFIPSVPSEEVPRLLAEDDQFYVFPLLGTYYYSFNLDHEIWQNAKIRKALALSIDRDAIVEAAGGIAVSAVGFVPPGFRDHEGNDFAETAGDYGIVTDDSMYDEAVKLLEEGLAESGLTREDFKGQVLLYNTSSGHQLIAQMVQEMWKTNLGIEVELANQEWAVFQVTRKQGEFDIARGGWLTDYMDPSGMLAIMTSPNAYNDPNYYSDEFDALMEAAMTATDTATHFEKLYEAQDVFMNDMPVVTVYHYSESMYVSHNLENWSRSVLGSIDFSQASIKE